MDPSTGRPRPVTSDKLVERNSLETDGAVNVSWLIRDVGRITTAFTTDFFRFLSGDPSAITRSQLGATFARPLLRNAGFQIEMENLTLAERETLYALRDFVRFRQQFSVDVAAAYYRVLQNRDAARNTYLALQSFRKNAARTQALVDEGRVKPAELGRLQQQELSQENAWIGAVRHYQLSLDNLKIQLGLPTDANLVLDEQELGELTILHPSISVEDAIHVTERTREIGLRRALGARRRDIVVQFLVETVLLSGVGGIIGVLVGVAVPHFVTMFAHMRTIVTFWSSVVAFTLSALVGVVFGLHPTLRAANMNPVEALRHE